MQVAAMLRGSENVINNPGEALTPAEQRALRAMDLDEVGIPFGFTLNLYFFL